MKNYFKFILICLLTISLFASCGTDDQDLVDIDAEVNIGDTINENKGTQIIVNSGDVYINQNSETQNNDKDIDSDNVEIKNTTNNIAINTNSNQNDTNSNISVQNNNTLNQTTIKYY